VAVVAEEEKSGSPLLIGMALVGAPVFLVVLLLIVLGGGATPPPAPCGAGGVGGSSPGVGALKVAGIPANYVPLIQKAGTVSPEFPAPVIAAQLSQESGFSDPTSSTGAQGPAQFEPGTWQSWGKDTTGKGYADVHNPSDAIDAQARFDAALAGQVKQAQAAGQIHSSASVTEMALGGYNAGFAAVVGSGGIPQNSQTMAYVPRIMTLARTTFSDAGTITAPGGTPPPADAGGTGTQAAGGCGGAGGQVAVHQVDYPVPGGGTQPADLYVPAGAGPGTPPRPIIVMVHGGGYVAGDRSELGDAAKAAAAHGYEVLNISYDLSAPRWPRQVQQVDAAVDYVRAQGTGQGIDPARVALLGDSAGAGLVLDAGLLGDHHGVQAVVSWSGPADFTSLLAQATPGDTYQQASAVVDPSLFLGCPMALCPDLWRQASPALSVTPGAPPTMLVNSDHELVPVAQVGEMTTALDRVGAASKTLVFPGTVHANGYTAQANGPSLDFLDASLHFTPPPPPAAAGGGGGGGPVAQLAVSAAKTQLGATYIWGGGDQNGPTGGGFDCSGLTLYAYHQAGSDVFHGARTAQAQYAATAGTRLPGGFDPASYQAGDLLFYGTADNIHHVAMAIGGGQLIQASTFGEPLNIKPIYHSDFFGATRPLGTPAGAPQ